MDLKIKKIKPYEEKKHGSVSSYTFYTPDIGKCGKRLIKASIDYFDNAIFNTIMHNHNFTDINVANLYHDIIKKLF